MQDLSAGFNSTEFVANAYVNSIANSKEASVSLQGAYSSINTMAERSMVEIVKIISANHKDIIDAVKETTLIEDDIKEMQNILSDQTRLLLDISSLNQPELIQPNEKYLGDMTAAIPSLPIASQMAEVKNNEISTLNANIRKLKNLIVEKKYQDIKEWFIQVRTNVSRLSISEQHIYGKKVSNIMDELCSTIIRQILNIHPLLQNEKYPSKKLISFLNDFGQHDLALDTYLKILSNKLELSLSTHHVTSSNYVESSVNLAKEFFNDYKNVLFDELGFMEGEPSDRVACFLWAKEQTKNLILHILSKSAYQNITYYDICKCIKSIIQVAKSHEDELKSVDFSPIIKHTAHPYMLSNLNTFVRRSNYELRSYVKKYAFSNEGDLAPVPSYVTIDQKRRSEADFSELKNASFFSILVFHIVLSIINDWETLINKSEIILTVSNFLRTTIELMESLKSVEKPDMKTKYNKSIAFIENVIFPKIGHFDERFNKTKKDELSKKLEEIRIKEE